MFHTHDTVHLKDSALSISSLQMEILSLAGDSIEQGYDDDLKQETRKVILAFVEAQE